MITFYEILEASTPAELGVNAQGQEERVQMTIEVGEVKVETEESFNYEVIDLVDDNDNNEYGNSQVRVTKVCVKYTYIFFYLYV